MLGHDSRYASALMARDFDEWELGLRETHSLLEPPQSFLPCYAHLTMGDLVLTVAVDEYRHIWVAEGEEDLSELGFREMDLEFVSELGSRLN